MNSIPPHLLARGDQYLAHLNDTLDALTPHAEYFVRTNGTLDGWAATSHLLAQLVDIEDNNDDPVRDYVLAIAAAAIVRNTTKPHSIGIATGQYKCGVCPACTNTDR